MRGFEIPLFNFKGAKGFPGNRLDSNLAGIIIVVLM
jgi:hypothetical protein